jgi:hypothetical protein
MGDPLIGDVLIGDVLIGDVLMDGLPSRKICLPLG